MLREYVGFFLGITLVVSLIYLIYIWIINNVVIFTDFIPLIISFTFLLIHLIYDHKVKDPKLKN